MREQRYELVGAAHQAIAVAVLEYTCADQAWVIQLISDHHCSDSQSSCQLVRFADGRSCVRLGSAICSDGF